MHHLIMSLDNRLLQIQHHILKRMVGSLSRPNQASDWTGPSAGRSKFKQEQGQELPPVRPRDQNVGHT